MGDLKLKDQDKLVEKISPYMADLISALEDRKELWEKAPLPAKSEWRSKDPVLAKAWGLYTYLCTYFGDLKNAESLLYHRETASRD